MERFGMALPLSSSCKTLASLLNGFNTNIIGRFFNNFNNSGLVLITVGSSSGSVIMESILEPRVSSQSGAATWTSGWRGAAGLSSASRQRLLGQNESQTKYHHHPVAVTGILREDGDLQPALAEAGEGTVLTSCLAYVRNFSLLSQKLRMRVVRNKNALYSYELW